ncbi:MAG: phosphoglycerate kinase [Candidatus Taylorbacteria bacterium]|nr:phosphoglycerate kinase [Candidatus Taylorbacteria bacterium]
MIKNIKEVENLDGVRVLVRLDLNVPIENGHISDDFRIRKALPLINYLSEKGAQLILISHIETKEKPTLEPVAKHLNKIGVECFFEKNYKKVLHNKHKIILLENLRENPGEKENDKKFAKELSSLADIYVNEAFSVSHRCHASVCAITEFISSYAGLQFVEEVKHVSLAFKPDHPFLFILGGAKFDTKLPLIEKFIDTADKIFIGGALANDFFKVQGKDIGNSLVSEAIPDLNKFINNQKLLLPIDSIKKDTAIMDVGMKTVEMLRQEIDKAKFILWNGPLGAYEIGYKASTLLLSEMLAEATKRGVKTIVGGGDTLATIAELKLEDSFTFVSTGGGAMLDFLAKGTLPGIEALERSEV